MASVGRTIQIVYTNNDTKTTLPPTKITVCPNSVVRNVVVRLVNVGSAFDSNYILNTIVPDMQRIWAQACVNVQVLGNSVYEFPSPPTNFVYPLFTKPQQFTEGNIIYGREVLSTDVKGIIDFRRKNDSLSYPSNPRVVTIYFVGQFILPKGDATANAKCSPPQALVDYLKGSPNLDSNGKPIYAADCTTFGEALTQAGTLKLMASGPSGFVGESIDYQEAAFVTTVQQYNKNVSDGKTVAHELAHVVINLDNLHDDANPNLLYANKAPIDSMLQKRFNSPEIAVIRGKNNFTAKPD